MIIKHGDDRRDNGVLDGRPSLARFLRAYQRHGGSLKGARPRRSSDGVVTLKLRCLTHDDVVPSLGVRWRPGNRPLQLRCFSSCDTKKTILPALGLTLADLYDVRRTLGRTDRTRSASGFQQGSVILDGDPDDDLAAGAELTWSPRVPSKWGLRAQLVLISRRTATDVQSCPVHLCAVCAAPIYADDAVVRGAGAWWVVHDGCRRGRAAVRKAGPVIASIIDLSTGTISCDFCGGPFHDDADSNSLQAGIATWDVYPSDNGTFTQSPVLYAHKGRCDEVIGLDRWRDLGEFLDQLVHNTVIRFELERGVTYVAPAPSTWRLAEKAVTA